MLKRLNLTCRFLIPTLLFIAAGMTVWTFIAYQQSRQAVKRSTASRSIFRHSGLSKICRRRNVTTVKKNIPPGKKVRR